MYVNNVACFRTNCKFQHLKGTKRSRDSEVGAEGSLGQPVPQHNHRPSQPPNPSQVQHIPEESFSGRRSNNPFLDQVTAINLQMKEMTSKLHQMETNYSSLQFQLHSISHQQPKLPHPQLSMLPPVYPHLPPA